MAKLEVASGKAVKASIKWYETINDWFKSFGIVTGGLAASLADWVFGTITMSVLLSRYSGWDNVYLRLGVGAIFSLALWGIQIILWQLILTGQIAAVSNNKKYTFWIYVVVFVIVIFMKFGDDISDLFGVYWMIRDNPMKDILPANWYSLLQATIFFLAWVVCGFSEVIMALSINLLKDEKGEQNKPNQHQQYKPQQNQVQHNQQQQFQTKKHQHGQNRRHFLEELHKLNGPLSSDTQPKFKSPFFQDEEDEEE